ncbi:MAG: ectonucleotide pyrophosphatase/phosphodiesterase [Verrucomicrobiales bacterium]|jgi:predicted AlkP superfamily pyrophosphatase or phosphodiesterase|nr:ectonucleotide pyrophosphatase/phosphodiesterase [Verrucomicrobiales bacterium]MDP4790731.1 ectonucleotide pyrophosphatase/phosphodiesterase [Verrucomicrobiales bacterium]MDP5005251.1 ectonucleotide pyrophosphatase/phosphodiesterase [Verrucomicrobiales bacterium]
MTRLIPLLALLLSLPTLSRAEPAKDQHVILVSIDGFPAYLWHDPTLMVPNLRKLAAGGASAKALTVSNPSITWINHTTLVTGVEPRKHGVLFNGLLVRKDGVPPVIEQWADKSRMVFVPTLYDVAHQAGLTTAESDWVAITNPGTINWSFAELPKPDDAVVKEMIAAGVATEEEIGWMQMGPNRKGVPFLDSMWTRAAIHMFETHRPNLLLYHTLNTDYSHHMHGPRSGPGFTALELADRLLGDLIDAVDRSGLREKTTIVVATDHGFKKVTQFVQPNVALKKAGLARGLGPTISSCDAYVMAQGGMAFAYVTNPARRSELLPRLREMFSTMEGIAEVIDGEKGHELGMPTPDENTGMGDLILFASEGYAFRKDVTGEEVVVPAVNYGGTHGYPASDPELDGIFIAHGPNIKPGTVVDRVSNLDVAPTLARIMGLTLPEVDGRAIEEIFKE